MAVECDPGSAIPAAIPSEFRTAPKRKPRDIELIQKPIPFTVISALCEASEYAPLVENAQYRKVRNPVENSIELKYSLDKFTHNQAGEVLEAIGGVRQKAGYYQFDYDPKRILNEVISSGCIPDHKSHQFYPTPSSLAELAVSYADLQDGMTSLEPSAGQGGLANRMHIGVTTRVEVSDLHCRILQEKGHRWIGGDFLKLDITDRFDRVVMNPPFSDGRWWAHVEHAAKLLNDDGVLVAIVPASAWNKYGITGYDVEWISRHDGEFSGTSVSVAIMRLKPL